MKTEVVWEKTGLNEWNASKNGRRNYSVEKWDKEYEALRYNKELDSWVTIGHYSTLEQAQKAALTGKMRTTMYD